MQAMSPELNSTFKRAFKRRHYPIDVILLCARWYVAYLGFKDFHCARILLGGIEMMHMIVKGQMKGNRLDQTPAEQFYSLIT
ncbi:hypothetical protein LMG28688_00359 [Paraburkholderia caffeinitolerans]|uniref:IS6 family transposase ISBmu21 n=1 Tax=Paraburkholderia caffeinitolerans TaxID=1723730 RepID=A0A6J5FGX2_9BURK|nr:hypothetical protein LMG28688_00359 [Paraburkholderia caffeinitolerans]